MPRNGSGGVTDPAGGFYPPVANTLIESAKVTISWADIKTMIAASIASDGQTVATVRIPFAQGIQTDSATEKTADTGVTLDSVLLKDGRVDTTQGADIASAATVNLETATGNVVDVTGTTAITAVTLSQGHWRLVRFTGALTLTHGASLVLPGAVNIRTVAGDYAIFVGYASSIVRVAHFQRVSSQPFLSTALKSQIYGFTYANNVGDATNDLDIVAGGAMDATGAYWLTGASLTKQSDVVWAVGNNAGALDTGAVGNSDYYIWVIGRSDTGVVDYLFSLSSTAPTMPTSYDYKRLIGWFKRVGGTIVGFKVYETEGGGIEMNWNAPTVDVSLVNTLTTSRRTDAVKVPLNFSVLAILYVLLGDGGNSFNLICCPDQTDVAVAEANCNAFTIAAITTVPVKMIVRTSAAGLIAARSTIATVDAYSVLTEGFTWARRN